MVKMRTEPANCGGGGTVASESSVIMRKSLKDVEAAFAIAQLSEMEPSHGRDCHVRTSSFGADSRLTNGCSYSNTPSPPRSNHVRSAVMPSAVSRVEKATVKRKFDPHDDDPAESAANSYRYKQARLQDTVDPVQTAITSERDTFLTACRRQQHHVFGSAEAACDGELTGRFVRTCAPSCRDTSDIRRPLHVKVSNPVVSPTLVSSVPSLFTTSPSIGREMVTDDDKPPVLSPAVTEHFYIPSSVTKQHRPTQHHDQYSTPYVSVARRTATSRGYSLPEYDRQVTLPRRFVPMSYNERVQQLLQAAQAAPGLFKPASYEDTVSRRHQSLVSACYNLGQTAAAAAAASQLMFVKPRRSVASRSHSAVRNPAAQLTGVQRRPPRVDSCTMQKVQRGEFGSLSTLRLYCNQLRLHSAPGSLSQTVKQSADDNEVAVDLSVRKHPVGEPQSDAVDATRYRTSRSCGSSPNVRPDGASECWQTVGQPMYHSTAADRSLLQMSSSLPCSPYTAHYDDPRHSVRGERHHKCDTVTATTTPATDAAHVSTERTSSDVTEASESRGTDVIPDSRLPLKKRRLLYQQRKQQQPDSLSVINEVGDDTDCNSAESIQARRSEVSSTSPSPSSTDREANERNVDHLRRFQMAVLCPNEDGDLPLHIAVAKGTAAAVESIISVMLSFGVSLDYCNNRQQTALHLAVLQDKADIVRQLLDRGASPNVVDGHGQTCVHVSVLLGKTECLELLLTCSRRSPHVDAVSRDGMTALHLAVRCGNTEAVRCLLSAGADVNVVDTKYGRTALYYAVERNDVAVAELLASFGASPVTATTYSSSAAPLQAAAYSTKCSTHMLQRLPSAMNYRHLPTCCPTG